ncbi:hypothetical protein AB0K00_45590 [Dactylosporangium sp. NPDC049525]|uniref:hypothetical protein n=1 Tax=Dactylosporangium sp. NPDC049525 TaxID=3154730 RepID=UPI00341402F1
MRVDHLAARVVAALARDGHDGPARVPLLAALSRDTPAFGGATTVSPQEAGPSWTGQPSTGQTWIGLTALLRRIAPPPFRPSTPPDHPSTPVDRLASATPDRPSTHGDRPFAQAEGPPRQAKREPWLPPLFSMPDVSSSRRMPSTTTRRLCAAVHLDAGLARRVVAELTDDPRRAVPPSVGFDLEPVLCHALRARLLAAARDGFLTVVVLVALVLAPRTTAAVLLLGAAAGLCRSGLVRAVPPAGRALFAAALVFGLVTAVGAALTVLGAAAPVRPGTAARGPQGAGDEFDRLAAAVGAAPGPRVWAAVAVLLAGAVAGHLAHLWWTGATLAAATHPAPRRPATARRVAVVAAAQRGNVAFSRADPFVGAGPRVRAWSVAVALRATDSGGYRPRSPATLDPVLLRRHVGQALQGLGDDGGGHSGVPGLTVTPYLAADGVRCDGDPLLDDGTPLPLASREALDAVVRGPQEGLRHYDRVVVLPRARGVTTAEGRPVVPADDGDGHVSVFVHTSIEASVVYVELSAHILPPIRTSCYVQQAPAVHLEMLTQLTAAPWRLARTGVDRLRAVARRAQRGGWHDHGARLGVRELVADPAAALPALEATKYVKIVERVVVEAVADFLERYDLDATTFRAEVPTAR